MARSARTNEQRGNSAAVTDARLEDREISDLASFDTHTRGERAVAGLLFYKELDCLVDVAHGVALDFFDRPQLYKDISGDLANDLAAFSARYGCEEGFLSREQRATIFTGIFGAGETGGRGMGGGAAQSDSFAATRDQLLAAAAAFAERVYDTGADMLRAAVRVMHVYLKDYLQDVSGASAQWSRELGLPAITETLAYRILRDPRIAARFGVNRAPVDAWPYRADANGAKLVEQISVTPIRVPGEPISRAFFNDKQQLALRGAEAISAVIDYDGSPDPTLVDLLIRKCYTWYVARGRVLRLPAAGAPTAPGGALLAAAPTMAPAGNGDRTMYGATAGELPQVIA
jgi:hypothetical protein